MPLTLTDTQLLLPCQGFSTTVFSTKDRDRKICVQRAASVAVFSTNVVELWTVRFVVVIVVFLFFVFFKHTSFTTDLPECI